jgi:serpin B
MKRPTLLLFVFTILLFPAARECSSLKPVETLIAANNAFAIDLYQRLDKHEGNLVFSPYSISTALAMTYAGARGRTEEEMGQVLHFILPQKELHEAFRALQADVLRNRRPGALNLHTANSLWRQDGYRFLATYLQLLNRIYGTEPFVVDFVQKAEEARLAINDWVAENTAGKIPDLIAPGVLDAATTLVLCNAIYFRGLWAYQFDPKQTVEGDFYVSPRDTIKTPMMQHTARLRFGAFGSCMAVELPYVGDELAMVLLLPDVPDGMRALEESLSASGLSAWLSDLFSTDPAPVRVVMPRFGGTSRFELADTLAAMGMPHAFHGADFSGMTGNRDLFISNIIHQAYIEVNEEGTEAAAATAVVMKRGRVTEFVADHPFLFLIIDRKTGSILFIGRVIDPSIWPSARRQDGDWQ